MSSPQVTRRAVARGVAWTVPIAAVSVAAPAFAVSGPAPTAVITSLCNCTSNGRKYRITVTFTNTIAQSFDISTMSVASGNNPTLAVVPAGTFTLSAVPGATVVTFDFTRTNNSSVLPLTFTFTATNNSNSVATIRTTPVYNSASASCGAGVC